MITINAIDGVSGNPVALNTLDGSVVEPLLQKLLVNPSLSTNGFGTVAAWFAKAATGFLLAVNATNQNAAVRYLQVFNSATAPATGAIPVYAFVLPAGTAAAPSIVNLTKEFFGAGGASFAAGIAFGVSTTLGTYTAATAADHVVNAHYV
jgi:hypothetical protein